MAVGGKKELASKGNIFTILRIFQYARLSWRFEDSRNSLQYSSTESPGLGGNKSHFIFKRVAKLGEFV